MRLPTTIAASTCLALAVPAVGQEAIDHQPVTTTIVADASPGWAAQVEWGLARFSEAGLTLPALSVSIHVDTRPCDGNSGLYHPGELPEVHLCSASSAGSRTAKMITLHELGHAWAETQLTAERRAAFLRLRRLETWVDRRHPPHEWGAEHAAEVVSWGLMDEMAPIIRIYDTEPEVLLMAFEQLTGSGPLWRDRS